MFDFTLHVRRVCEHMVAHLPELAHIELAQVAISFSQVRSRVAHGIQATLTPLRFEGGALTSVQHGRRYTVQRLYDPTSGAEILYILCLYVPRFLNHPLEEKVATILHELWHISPEFNGDLRRFAGRCYAHGPNQKDYDAQVEGRLERLGDLFELAGRLAPRGPAPAASRHLPPPPSPPRLNRRHQNPQAQAAAA